ncbi:DUF1189 family protein [Oceanirhabdus sp. W0125-5]|uniref:DUF1189 family protein n=1 Tax=Oceanirhabdus sp. W0125-5 TaxID=2999116 RepID=UPI0022F2BB1F|nr:DUF1189 family protein [Oceanirhabdus sp. W0125-5]WBW98528.1 DUF1189 family protein [Oceanirhabdus sp. W0125-5]
MKNNIFLDLFYSIFKLDDYSRYAKEKISRTIVYVLLLTTLLSVFIVYKPFVEIKGFYDFLSQKYVSNELPELKIENGKLIVNGSDPYKVSDDDILFSINSKIEESSVYEEFAFYNSGIVLSEDKAYVKYNRNILVFPYELPISPLGTTLDTIDTQIVKESLIILMWAPVMIFIYFLISLLISNFTFILIIAFMLNISADKKYIKFSDLFKLAAHGATLSLIFKVLEFYMFSASIITTLIIYILAYIYTINGLKSLVKERTQFDKRA